MEQFNIAAAILDVNNAGISSGYAGNGGEGAQNVAWPQFFLSAGIDADAGDIPVQPLDC